MSNLLTRLLSGLAYVVVFVAAILYGQGGFCILFALVTALALHEFNELLETHQLATVNSTMSMIMGVYLFLSVFCLCTRSVSPVIFLPYLLSVMFVLINELYMKRSNPLANWSYTFAGQFYIALPFALMNLLAFHGDAGYSGLLPLAIFIFIWINDTGAYCFGTALHKKIPYKLFERISPHKSWIGSIGGTLTVLVSAAVFSCIDSSLSLFAWLGLGLTVAVFATWGDLVESLFKRQLGIKDSGRFLPGHGGVLDRFDSALLAIPAAVVYLYSLHFLS